MSYKCDICNKKYNSYQSFWNHNKAKHDDLKIKINNDNISKCYECKYCGSKFTRKFNMENHIINSCKFKNKQITKTEKTKNNNLNNLNELKETNYLNTIREKTDEIVKLNNEIAKLNEINKLKAVITIEYATRPKDNFLNATLFCNITGKEIKEWLCLATTKLLIQNIELLKPTEKAICLDEYANIWIHPNTVTCFLSWISPQIVVNVINNSDLVNKIKDKDEQIKNLESKFEKQKRENFPNNVVYIISNDDNIKKNIYIIGKASCLKNRLSSYNKTCEHKVIFYKECENKRKMHILESLVIDKLIHYKEKPNRDRFILPKNKSINFFTDIINDCAFFINNKINDKNKFNSYDYDSNSKYNISNNSELDNCQFYKSKSAKEIDKKSNNSPHNQRRRINTEEEEKILNELANSGMVIEREKMAGIFSDSDSDCESIESESSDESQFYKLKSTKKSSVNKEIEL